MKHQRFFFRKKTIIIIMVVGNGRCSIALLAYTRVYRFQETLQKSRMCVSQAFWGPWYIVLSIQLLINVSFSPKKMMQDQLLSCTIVSKGIPWRSHKRKQTSSHLPPGPTFPRMKEKHDRLLLLNLNRALFLSLSSLESLLHWHLSSWCTRTVLGNGCIR